MVVRVRQAMIVPLSVQGGANGCKVARHLQTSRDLCLQSAAMEKKMRGGAENGKRGGGHDHVGLPWQRATSESSLSSTDSLPPVEIPPSESHHPSFHRKARLGLHASESDDEPMTDPMPEEVLMSKKSRRPLHPGTSDEVVPDHGSTPSEDGKDLSSRVKFMCSFGGKIFPRPSDGKLRYVGGDTKIIAVHRDTNFLELMAKMRDVYGQALTLKYQLPDEDLDALVSVSSDEDLQNMMEEYDKLDMTDGSSRLRVFLFPTVDYDSSSQRKDSSGDLRNSEQRYVDAVNGIPEVVGPRSYGAAGAAAFGLDNLLGLDVPETWSLPRGPDPVPVALLAPQIAHDVATHIHRVPVAVPISNRSNAPSAPSSAPSSPPLLPRPALAKLPVDVHLQYHQDVHVKLPPQYNVLIPDVNYQDNESYGAGSGASSAASQHESLYRSTDSRRGPDSPPRKQQQHEGGHQDHSHRSEQRRIPEQKMPRAGSHGKLSRLVEHVEMAPSSTAEIQQMAESQLPDIQRLLQQQQQQQQQQSHHQWQHPMDPQQDSYRRADLLQSTVNQNAVLGQQQQHQSTHFRPVLPPGIPTHDGVYRQGDQPQYSDDILHQLTRSVSSHTATPGVASASSYHVGSDPSSPRVTYVSSRHVAGPQQLPIHWPYSGTAFTEQPPYVRRVNYGDQSGRSFRPSNSPPKFREHLAHAEERLLRQQQTLANLVNSESYHHEQVPKSTQQLLYESNPVSQPYDLLPRPQVPLYKGLNPFQEKLMAYQDHPEIAEARRHQIPQQGQQHLHALHQNQRHDYDYQDPMLQPMEQMSGHPRYQESQHKVAKVAEWDSEEARLGFRNRPRMPLDEDFLVDAGGSHQRDMQQSVYPGLHLPETSDDLLASSGVGDYTAGHVKSDRLDHPGSSAFHFRPGMLPPSALSGYPGSKSRTSLPDPSLVPLPRYVGRTNDPEYLPPGGLRGGGNAQDPRSSLFEVNGHQHTVPAACQGLQVPPISHRLMEERPVPAFNPVTQQMQNLRLGDSMLPNSEVRWNAGLGTDDARMDPPVAGRDLLGGLFEDRLQGLPNLAVGRGGRVSRPPSSSNIPSLHEEDLGEVIHLLPYGTQCRNGSLIEDDPFQNIPAIENPLFTSNVSKYSGPAPVMDTIPVTSTGMFLFDPTPACSTSSEYNDLAGNDDFPNIKTIATQVPSIEGDESDGSSSSSEGSVCSSEHESGERILGQLTMTQHLAEDMASCVLATSPVKRASEPQARAAYDHDESVTREGQPLWPLEAAPTLSPSLWENALDEVALAKGFNNGEIHVREGTAENISENAAEDTEDNTVHETLSHSVLASIAKEEEQEEHLEVKKKRSSGRNIADAAADEAIAHGLQTIKNADLEELRELGSGTFGTVYHGKWRGTDVAIKRIKASCFAGRPSEQERLIADFWREACNLGNLHHPNVVAFYGVVSDGPGGTLATVTEYMVNGSLKQVLQKKDRTIDRRKRLMIAMDAAFGMEYLHGKNIVHFDLKCENLLVNMRDPHRPICKVGDLGLSKVKHQTMVSGGVRGTLPWMAPELLNGSSSLVTEKVDVFSFGIVMWELLTGEEPYANMHYGAIIGGIVNNSLRPPVPSWCDPAWRSLMERCWSADPANRPAFSEIASELRAMSDSLKAKTQQSS